jgi:hypothetical protein
MARPEFKLDTLLFLMTDDIISDVTEDIRYAMCTLVGDINRISHRNHNDGLLYKGTTYWANPTMDEVHQARLPSKPEIFSCPPDRLKEWKKAVDTLESNQGATAAIKAFYIKILNRCFSRSDIFYATPVNLREYLPESIKSTILWDPKEGAQKDRLEKISQEIWDASPVAVVYLKKFLMRKLLLPKNRR